MTRNVGQLGESVLTKWAAEVNAAINKAVIDRTGWDFLVEFGISTDDTDESRPLDLMPSPLQCLIQVKSTDTGERRIKTSLANWLRLVRSPLPTFFLLLDFGYAPECTQAYLIHVGDRLMYRTLKRLRSLTARATPLELGKRTLTYTVSTDEHLSACDGKTLAGAIRGYVHPDFDTYVANKCHLLETLGYEQESKRLDFKIRVPDSHVHGDSADLLVDFAIGTVRELDVASATVTNVRFGIPAPKPDDVLDSGTLSIKRTPVKSGSLTLRNDTTNDSIILPCDIYAPAGVAHLVPTNRIKFRLSVPGGDFVLNPSGSTTPLTIRLPEGNRAVPISTLHSVACLIRFLSTTDEEGKLTCSIYFESLFLARLKMDQFLIDPSLARWAKIISDAKEVVDRTNMPADLEVEWDRLCAQEDALVLMRCFLAGDTDAIIFSFTMSPPCERLGRACIPYIVGVTVGEHRVVSTVLLQGNIQAMGEMPAAKVVVPVDVVEIVDRWVLFRDEPLPHAVSVLLDAVVSRCGHGNVVVRLDHKTVAV